MSMDRENAPDKAARLGLVVVMPEPDELLIDIDSDAELNDFWERLSYFERTWGNATVAWTRSAHDHWHAYVKCPGKSFHPMQRIALEASLGSDFYRCMIAVLRLCEGYQYSSCFFEVPGTTRTPEPWKPILLLTDGMDKKESR